MVSPSVWVRTCPALPRYRLRHHAQTFDKQAHGAGVGTRTPNLTITSRPLYLLKLRQHDAVWGTNRYARRIPRLLHPFLTTRRVTKLRATRAPGVVSKTTALHNCPRPTKISALPNTHPRFALSIPRAKSIRGPQYIQNLKSKLTNQQRMFRAYL